MIELWTQTDCPECEALELALAAHGAAYIVRDVEDIGESDGRDDARSQLAMQDMRTPLVRIGGTWTDAAGLRAWMLAN
jgi:glutaredoxin